MIDANTLQRTLDILQNLKVLYSAPPNNGVDYKDVTNALDLVITYIKNIDNVASVNLKERVLTLTNKLHYTQSLLEFIAKDLSKITYSITGEYTNHLKLLQTYEDRMKEQQLLDKR